MSEASVFYVVIPFSRLETAQKAEGQLAFFGRVVSGADCPALVEAYARADQSGEDE